MAWTAILGEPGGPALTQVVPGNPSQRQLALHQPAVPPVNSNNAIETHQGGFNSAINRSDAATGGAYNGVKGQALMVSTMLT